MNSWKIIGFFALLFAGPLSALEEADRLAIQNLIREYTVAWNDHAGKGFGDSFTEEADYVNIFGMRFVGREEIEDRHLKILQSFLKDSKLEILDTQLREVQPGLVIGAIDWKTHGFRNPGSDLTKPGTPREGIFIQVFIQSDGKWLITASQNTLKPN